MKIAFTIHDKLNIEKSVIESFVECNAAPKDWELKQAFYSLVKEPLLQKFGHMAGYDLQVIEKKCWGICFFINLPI